MKTTAKAKHCKAMNSIATIGIIALAVIVTLALTACGGVSRSDFNGTWVENTFTYTITAREITMRSNISANFVRSRIDSVTPMTNTDSRTAANYPTGFRFDLTVIESNDVHMNVGNRFHRTLFMHPSKREFNNDGFVHRKR